MPSWIPNKSCTMILYDQFFSVKYHHFSRYFGRGQLDWDSVTHTHTLQNKLNVIILDSPITLMANANSLLPDSFVIESNSLESYLVLHQSYMLNTPSTNFMVQVFSNKLRKHFAYLHEIRQRRNKLNDQQGYLLTDVQSWADKTKLFVSLYSLLQYHLK